MSYDEQNGGYEGYPEAPYNAPYSSHNQAASHHEGFEQAVSSMGTSNLGSRLVPVDFSLIPKVEINHKVLPPSDMTEADCVAWCQSNGITISGKDVPKPILEFEGLRGVIPDVLFGLFQAENIVKPTPIQSVMWPAVLSGKDFVGIARTGSGKTLGFLIPAVAHILNQPYMQNTDPIVVALSPTRELAIQIHTEAAKAVGYFRNINTACLYGGLNMREQAAALRGAPLLVVATPGRLIDMLERKQLTLIRTSMVIVDEADRMLDAGFSVQLNLICDQVRPDRQSVLLSATWPKEVAEIAARYTYFPITVRIGSEHLLANSNVRQHICAVDDDEGRRDIFFKLLKKFEGKRVLVFVDRKETADSLANDLTRNGVPSSSIHGDKEQSYREQIIKRFKESEKMCLVATDVASRGLDIKGLDVVVNYIFPTTLDDYVHRIGRTGRAERIGDSFTFVSKSDNARVISQLINVMKRASQKPPSTLFNILGETPETFRWDEDLRPDHQKVVPAADFVKSPPRRDGYGYPAAAPYYSGGGYPPAAPYQDYHAHGYDERPPYNAASAAPPPSDQRRPSYDATADLRRRDPVPPRGDRAPLAAPVVDGHKRSRESTFSAYGDGPDANERW